MLYQIALFLVLICLGACEKKETHPEEAIEPVSVITAIAKDNPVSFEFIANTQSSHQVTIAARVDGFLDQRVYTEGAFVKKDQVLFIMDKRPFEAQVAAAQAAVERAKAAAETARLNLERVKPLTELKALSQKDLDDAIGAYETNSATVEQMKANLITAELNLSYCTITSPINGVTSYAIVQDGTYLNAVNSKLTTVSALNPMWVNFSISQNQMQGFRDEINSGKLKLPSNGEFKVRVILTDGRYFPYTGSITFTQPYYNTQTGTFLIRATVKNPRGVLRPNQYVRAKIEGGIRPNSILVPQRAVMQSAKGNFVWVINKENKAEYRPVTVGEWQGLNWFIDAGLQSGEKVVVDGGMKLHEGQKVKITITSVAKSKSAKAAKPN